MASTAHKRIELAANVAIIIVAVLLGYFLIQKFFFPVKPVAPPIVKIENGIKVDIPNVDWQKNQKTLVLYVRKGCHFCTESMPFYKILVENQPKTNTKLVVVSPDETDVSKKYLSENGIEVNYVEQANLSSIGVHGTPTLLLVNDKGEVSNSWVGKLPSDEEKEVTSQL